MDDAKRIAAALMEAVAQIEDTGDRLDFSEAVGEYAETGNEWELPRYLAATYSLAKVGVDALGRMGEASR